MSEIILRETPNGEGKKPMPEIIKLKLIDGRVRNQYGKIETQPSGNFSASILIDVKNNAGKNFPITVEGFVVRPFKRIGSARRAILDYLASAP